MPDPYKIVVDGIVSRRRHSTRPLISLVVDEPGKRAARWYPEPLPDDLVDRWVRTGKRCWG
jgi:hypothetical protein